MDDSKRNKLQYLYEVRDIIRDAKTCGMMDKINQIQALSFINGVIYGLNDESCEEIKKTIMEIVRE